MHTPGLFAHKTSLIWLTMVMDDFGIKYVGKEHADHLMSVLHGFCEVEEDWTGLLYCKIIIDWYYQERYLDISMQNYISKKLLKYKWQTPKWPQFCSFSPAPVTHDKKLNMIIPKPESPKLDKAGKTYMQQVVGSFLYYVRTINMTILHALSEIALQKANPTKWTLLCVTQLLNYMTKNPNEKRRFQDLGMILNIFPDAFYLTATQVKCRAGGIFPWKFAKGWLSH